jgi:hypothetical protein
VETGYLGQNHLREAEEEHVVAVASHGARRVVAVPVVAVGPLNRPAYTMTKKKSFERFDTSINLWRSQIKIYLWKSYYY